MKNHSEMGRGVGAGGIVLAAMIAVSAGCSAPSSTAARQGRSRTGLITHNGFSENGLSTNGLTQNGFSENGFSENGFSENGFSENGFSENGVSQYGLSPLEIMESDPNAVEFVKYAYSCAMPPGTTMTLVINGESVLFEGSLGLAPEWGGDNGTCNESCKRWVSACLLARTNAYGAHVEISLRAPRSLFQANGDIDALERTQYLQISESADPALDEATLFPLREGAYFGNIFASKTASDGTLIQDPKYFACAGPGSNVPQLTNRFCSSQGDGCVIFTGDPNSTAANPSPPLFSWDTCTDARPACAGVDDAPNPTVQPNHAVHGCTGADGVAYKEVITIYLKRPITVCGNHICEGAVPGAIYDASAVPEDAVTCPDDCHPGTWAKSVDLHQIRCTTPGRCFEANETGQFANLGRRLFATDDSLLRGMDYIPGSTGNVDFSADGVAIPLLPPDNKSFYAAYKPASGTPLFARFLPPWSVDPSVATRLRALSVDKDGNTVVSMSSPLWVAKVAPDGTLIWANNLAPNGGEDVAGAITTDVFGDVVVAYAFQAAGAPLGPTNLSKLSTKDGSILWTIVLKPVDPNVNLTDSAISTDAAGNIHFTDDGNLYGVKSDGAPVFTRGANSMGAKLKFTALSTDAAGNAFVGGSCETADFGTGPLTGPAGFVVKFDSGGNIDLTFAPYFQVGRVYPVALHLDQDGNVVVAGGFFGDGAGPDFGAMPFNSWGSPDTFVAARSATDGKFVWAKQFSLVTAGGLDAFALGRGGKVFASGGFDGSMLLDGYQLINSDPGAVGNQNLFTGGFTTPCGTPGCDTTPPVFDPRSIPGDRSAVGRPLVVYATSRVGARVFYTPPTARNQAGDKNYDGVTVNCLPASGGSFPVGATTVRCTATDAHGNAVQTNFPVTVLATAGPVLRGVPEGVIVGASDGTGAIVEYRAPTAADQVDGALPVTCNPPSGSRFPVGLTIVTCASKDQANPPNVTYATFPVEVTLKGAPTITVPNPGPVVDATKRTGAVVTYVASAKDATGSSIPVVCTPPSGSLFPLGPTMVSCLARDAAGNTAMATFNVTVRFKWSGFVTPNNDGSSVFRLKTAVTVKFALGNIKDAAAHLKIAKITNGVAGPEQNASPSGSFNSGNSFKYDKSCNQYRYDMATKSLTKGVWRLRVDLHDGETHVVNITLK